MKVDNMQMRNMNHLRALQGLHRELGELLRAVPEDDCGIDSLAALLGPELA